MGGVSELALNGNLSAETDHLKGGNVDASASGNPRSAQDQPIKGLLFDAYGTLFDVASVLALCEELFPGKGTALSQMWRTKQLEYSWLRSLMGHYEDFSHVTDSALVFSCNALQLVLSPAAPRAFDGRLPSSKDIF